MALLRGCLSTLFVATFFIVVVSAFPTATDPCSKIGGKIFVSPVDVLACEKSFSFNETLRQNVLTNIARVFDFFTFEHYYLNSPPPFQGSTIDIRQALAKINTTKYNVSKNFSNLIMHESGKQTDHDFHKDLYDFTTQLNDGHTRTHFLDIAALTLVMIPTRLASELLHFISEYSACPNHLNR